MPLGLVPLRRSVGLTATAALLLCASATAGCADPELTDSDLVGTWQMVAIEPVRLPLLADTTTIRTRDDRLVSGILFIDSLRLEIGPAVQFDPTDSGLR